MGTHIDTDCAIVGGGPAGLMLALALLRHGIRVTVIEKHADFLRDFRGDTIHPSTQDLLADLGLLEEFLARPHDDMPRVSLSWQGTELTLPPPGTPLLFLLDSRSGLGLHLALEVLDFSPNALHTLGDLFDAVDETPLHRLGEVDAPDQP